MKQQQLIIVESYQHITDADWTIHTYLQGHVTHLTWKLSCIRDHNCTKLHCNRSKVSHIVFAADKQAAWLTYRFTHNYDNLLLLWFFLSRLWCSGINGSHSKHSLLWCTVCMLFLQQKCTVCSPHRWRKLGYRAQTQEKSSFPLCQV